MVHLGTLWYSWIYWSWTTFDGNIDILSQIGLMVFHGFPSKEAQEWYITQGMCQEFQETALGSSKCVTRRKEGNISIFPLKMAQETIQCVMAMSQEAQETCYRAQESLLRYKLM